MLLSNNFFLKYVKNKIFLCTLYSYCFVCLDARNGSVVYTRLGKKICPSNAELVFSGEWGLIFLKELINDYDDAYIAFLNCPFY